MKPSSSPAIDLPSPSFETLALRLDAAIADELRAAMSRLVAQDVPPLVVAQTMLRLAATVIRDTDGAKTLRATVADTLNDLIAPRD